MQSSFVSTGIPFVFFGLAAWFLLGPQDLELPKHSAAQLDPGSLAIQPRALMADVPVTEVGGVELDCQACHSLFETDPTLDRELYQHEHIRLEHGLNDRCLNCHSTQDRNKLVLHGEREIGFGQVQQLCAKCHGPTFRGWERGMHGKTLGFWDRDAGEPRRLMCTECHDPHAPAFHHIVPLPGPNTLRMGSVPDEPASPHGKRNPLQSWREHLSSDSQPVEHP